MFGLRKWVERVATEAAKRERDVYAAECAMEPVNIDSRLDDGTILCYAWEKRLLSANDWLLKARAWQEEFRTEDWYRSSYGEYLCPKRPDKDIIAVTIRKYAADAAIEVAQAQVVSAKAHLKTLTEKK